MQLKKLMVDTKSVWMDFAGLTGFSVEVANLSRKELTALRKRCTSQKFDRKSRQLMEDIDEDKFVKEFTKASVKNWKGLTLEHLTTLMLVDTSDEDPEKEVPYSEENAEVLVANSAEFDTWLNEVVFDLENFRQSGEGRVPKPTRKAVSE
jgi:hypothetical protein